MKDIKTTYHDIDILDRRFSFFDFDEAVEIVQSHTDEPQNKKLVSLIAGVIKLEIARLERG